jgi:hypothetical protein
MKKRIMTILVFAVTVFLWGCQSDNHSLVLLNEDGSVYETYDNIAEGNFSLPILEVDDRIFAGWTDGDTTYLDSIFVDGDLTLTANIEVAEDVFDTTVDSYTGQLKLNEYTGEAKYLIIPSKINNLSMEVIGTEAFKDSNVESVKIPATVNYIAEYAFRGANNLKTVSFYGTPEGIVPKRMQEDAMEDFLRNNTDGCTIAHLKGYGTETKEGQCSVITYFRESSMIIDRETITFYNVQIDIEKAPQYGKVMIGWHSFSDVPSLQEIHFPSWASDISGKAFEGSNQISTITIPSENIRFKAIDNVIYNKDRTELIYYPNGLEETKFEIPGITTKVMPYAFAHNDVIEEITIPENLMDLEGGFIDMKALTSFVISEDNEKYASRDGLLFSRPNFYLEQYRLEVYPGGLKSNSFTLTDDIIEVGDYAFAYNEHLTHLDLSENIKEIGHYAFQFSENIKILDIPESVRVIRTNICGDSGVEVVILRGMVRQGNYNSLEPVLAFQYLNNNIEEHPILYVPDEAYFDYRDMVKDTVVVDFLKPISEYEE